MRWSVRGDVERICRFRTERLVARSGGNAAAAQLRWEETDAPKVTSAVGAP